MIALFAYLAVVGLLLALAARAVEEMLRLAKRPTRWAWAGAFIVLLVLAVRAVVIGPEALLPASDLVSLPAAAPASPAAETTPWHSAIERLAVLRATVVRAPLVLSNRIADAAPASAARGFAVAWLAMSVVALALITIVYRRFSIAVRALPATELHGMRVRVSRRTGPAVIGLVDPQVVVPTWLLHAAPDEQRLAVVHEREHLAARDPQLLVAACIAVAALPWHPATWWMLSRLRLAVELDCDRRVLAAGISRRLYGNTLIDIAARGGRLPLAAPALADHTTHLERRLVAMAPATPRYRRTRLLTVAAAALLTTIAACEARLPSSAELEAMDVAAVERNPVTRAALAGDTAIAYFVNGQRVTAEASRAITAQDIASVEVNKSAAQKEIRITTKSAAAARSEPVAQGAPTAGVRPLGGRDFAGLIVVDGTLADEAALARLTSDQVASMEVLKGEAARRLYDDPRAANGVIRVTTRK